MTQKTDEELDAMTDGDFYHYMLDKDHYVWAQQANRKLKLGLSADAVDSLATWFASAMCAVKDREHAGYIRARLDAEHEEDLQKRTQH
jgi:hypothetical protein